MKKGISKLAKMERIRVPKIIVAEDSMKLCIVGLFSTKIFDFAMAELLQYSRFYILLYAICSKNL